MALQVWLPLNGTLENQGLSNVTVTNHGATIDNNGKIGKCYKNTANGNYISLDGYMTTLKTYQKYSMCAWVYISELSTGHSASILSSGNWNHPDGNLCFALYNKVSNGYTSILIPNRGHWNNAISAGQTLTIGNWYHICVTYDSSVTKLYINGQYKGSKNLGGICSVSNSNNLYIGAATYTNGFTLKGSLNDIRIYDHCLSPKEVKEISKGLVLHYTLDDYSRNTLLPPGVELYDYIQSDGTLWIDTKYVPNDTSGIYLRAYCTTSGGNHLAIGCRQTSGNTRWWINYSNTLELSWNLWTGTLTGYTNTWTEVEHNYMNSRSAKVNGTTYSVSYPTLANITYSAYLFNSCNQGNLGTGFIGRISNAKITEGTSIVRNYLPCTYLGEPGMWDTVENKFYKNLGTGQFILGNKITTTYNDNIIYDCSGYLNNGNITGNLIIVSDSPRYTTSVSVDSSEFTTITKQNLSLPDGPTTLSFWSKPEVSTTVDDSKIDIRFSKCHYFTYINYPYFSHDEDYYYKYTNYWSDGNWHLVTCTYDGTIPKMYIDGVLISSDYRTTTVTYSDNLILKLRKNSMSDFRIYATALSDEDIKELYDTSAIVDNFGNSYCYQFEELMDNIELNVPLWKFNKTSNPGGISFDGKDLVFTGYLCASYSEYIEVDITKTFYYDITYSSQEGSRFSIGFEKYDENKASTSNSGCVYIISTGGDVADKIRKTGTFTFGTINGNPCKYTKIRVLSCWTNSTIRDGVGKIHSFHFALVDGTGNSEVTKQGLIKTGWFIEDELLLTLISKNKYMTTNELIEI